MTVTWNQIWTRQKWQRAKDMRANGMGDDEIAKVFGLTEQQVTNKFTNAAHSDRGAIEKQKIRAALDERDALLATPRPLTAIVCGDPLPGRSALDKQRMNLAEPPKSSTDDQVGLSIP